MNHRIENSDFFDLDERFNNYVTNQIKKHDFYLGKYDFKLFSDRELYPNFKSELQYTTTIFHLKRFSYLGLIFSEKEGIGFLIITNELYIY